MVAHGPVGIPVIAGDHAGEAHVVHLAAARGSVGRVAGDLGDAELPLPVSASGQLGLDHGVGAAAAGFEVDVLAGEVAAECGGGDAAAGALDFYRVGRVGGGGGGGGAVRGCSLVG